MNMSTALKTGTLAMGLVVGLGVAGAQAGPNDRYYDGHRDGYHQKHHYKGGKHYDGGKHYRHGRHHDSRYYKIRGRYYQPDHWHGRRATVVNHRGDCITRKVYYDGRGRYTYKTRRGVVHARPYIHRGEVIFAPRGWQPNHFRPVAYVHRDDYRHHNNRGKYYGGYQHSYHHDDDSDVGALIFGAAVLGLFAAAAASN